MELCLSSYCPTPCCPLASSENVYLESREGVQLAGTMLSQAALLFCLLLFPIDLENHKKPTSAKPLPEKQPSPCLPFHMGKGA